MDQELQSYLHSMKPLNELLQNDSSSSVSTMDACRRDEMVKGVVIAPCRYNFLMQLDDNSSLLLKDLLDRASEDVFNIQDKNRKNCRVCQRPKLLAKTPSFATTNGTKSSALSVEGNGKLRSSNSFSKSSASDAIKQIEKRILEISDLSTRVQELYDTVSKPESASIVAVQQPVMLATNAPSKTRIDPVDEFLPFNRKGGHSREVRKYQPSPHQQARRRYPSQHESDSSSSSGSEEYYSDGEECQSDDESGSQSDDGSQEFSVSSGDDEGEVYSRRSRDRHHASTSRTSYENKRNSQVSYSEDDENEARLQRPRRPKYFAVGSTSFKKMRLRRVVSSRWKVPGKKMGKWKKLKDKIFHRHHNTRSGNRKKAYGRLPLKRVERRAVEKNDKALIHGRDSKVVQKSVYAMRGLLKHVRRSKRSKPSAKRFIKYGKTSTAKLNWLKIF